MSHRGHWPDAADGHCVVAIAGGCEGSEPPRVAGIWLSDEWVAMSATCGPMSNA